MIQTDESLLVRLKGLPAHEAWQEFYRGYWSAIVRYARKLGLPQAAAEEVLQETMVALMRVLPGFTYDPGRGRFRNFLLTIVHRKAMQALRRNRSTAAMTVSIDDSESDELPLASALADAGELTDPEAAEALGRWRESLLEDSLARLREDPSVDPRTLAVFEAYVVQRRPAGEVAAAHGMTENAVYQIKNRITRRLRIDTERRLRESGSNG